MGTGSGSPLRGKGPRSVKEAPERLPPTARTRAVTKIWPPLAALTSRAASTTGLPKTSSSSKVTSPRARPTRMASGAAPRRTRRSTACCMATAQLTASAAELKTAKMPSPSVLISSPPWWSIASRRALKWARRSSSKAVSPMRESSSVDPTSR